MTRSTVSASAWLALAVGLGGCAVDRFVASETSTEPGEGEDESESSAELTGESSSGDGDPSTGDGDPATGDGDGDGDPATGDGDGDDEFPLAITSLAYGPELAQTVQLYTADPPLPDRPLVVLAHGGLWQAGDPSNLAGTCTRIVSSTRGTLTCASLGYRLSDSLGGTCDAPGVPTYREQLDDFAAALAHLQSHAADHGIDPGAVWIGGHSAGGHLAQLLNLRYDAFAAPCEGPGACGPPRGAIGFEGIYDVAAWDAYDQQRWNGQFACATRKAFGAPPSADAPCLDPELGSPCWAAGSPRIVAEQHELYAAAPAGPVLLIHSPGDDWVDIAEASTFEASLAAAFPELDVLRSTDGTCASGRHSDLLMQQSLADCISTFVTSEGEAFE